MKRSVLLFCIIFVCLNLQATDRKIKPTLIIGGDQNYPPYEYINSKGYPDGYNVELSRLVCDELGYKPIFRLGKWALVRAWLENGGIDVAQGMAYSQDRASELEFSNSHTRTWRGIFVQRKSRIRDLKDNPDLLVVIQEDDIAEEYLKQIGFLGKTSKLSNQEEALKLLNDGIYDAAVANYMTALYIIQQEGLKKIKALPHRINQRDYCYASKDANLIAQINSALQHLENNGELQRLHNKWFANLDNPEAAFEAQKSVAFWLAAGLAIALVALLILAIMYFRRQKHWQKELGNCKYSQQQNLFYDKAYRNLFTSGRIIMYRVTHSNRKLIYISDSIQDWGYTTTEIMDGGLNIIFPEDRERYREYFNSLNQNTFSETNYRIVTKDGELRWVWEYGKLYANYAGDEQEHLGYLIDITEFKAREVKLYTEREEAEADARAKTHFCAIMSHEIRNAVNGSFGFIQVLRQMNKDPEIEELLAYLYSAELSMVKMLDNVLDYNKLDSGKVNLIYSNFDLKRLIVESIKAAEMNAIHKDVKLLYHLNSDLPQLVFGDQLRLKQIFTNLLQNAQKFTQSGKIEFAAELYARSESEIRILFKVEDSGIGIPQERLKDIFDNYTQAEDTIGLKYGGSGLGLFIVKKLVELMHGFIWVESEPKKGSCFYFIIPFAIRARETEGESKVQAPEIIQHPLLKGRVLLAEDQKLAQLFGSKVLSKWGLKVDIAGDGEEAVRLHKEKLYDIILVNSQLPVLDVFGVSEQIRKLEQGLNRKTPVIVAIEPAWEENILHLKASGIDECIIKPVDIDILYKMLSKYLPKAEKDKD